MEELIGQIALESRRARCLVIGEDLGTVPEGMGEALQSAAILSYRVLWFERQGPALQPARVLAGACRRLRLDP
jgi:glycogen operon protein